MDDFIKLLAFLLLVVIVSFCGIAVIVGEMPADMFINSVVKPLIVALIAILSYKYGYERGYKRAIEYARAK